MTNFQQREKHAKQKDARRGENSMARIARVAQREQRLATQNIRPAAPAAEPKAPEPGWKREWKRLVKEGGGASAPDTNRPDADEQAWLTPGTDRLAGPLPKAKAPAAPARLPAAGLRLPAAPAEVNRRSLARFAAEACRALLQFNACGKAGEEQLAAFMRGFVEEVKRLTAGAPPEVRPAIAKVLEPAWDVRGNKAAAGPALEERLRAAMAALELQLAQLAEGAAAKGAEGKEG